MDFDLVIRGASVYPGDAQPLRADVGVRQGRIEAVEPSLLDVASAEAVDAAGLMLCPGFIDMHAHTALRSFEDPGLVPKIAQGFTTELIHPDGLAPAPVAPERREERRAYLRALEGSGPEVWAWSAFDEYLDALAETKPALTLVPSAVHNSAREFVMGGARRAPTAEELREMRRQIRLCFEAGARTLSFGLIYLPGAYADTDELVALAEEAAAYGAPLVPHVRNEGQKVLEAVAEMALVARRSGAPLHVSHLKVIADETLVEPLLALIDEEGASIDLTFDQYPYGAGSTLLSALLPAWAQEGGAAGTLERLRDDDARRDIIRDVRQGLPGWENLYGTLGPERITIANAGPPREDTVGKSLAEVAGEADPLVVTLDLLVETNSDVTMISHYASDEVVRTIARHPRHLVGSDSIYGTRPHPRLYGTAPRFLGRYAMRDGLVSVEEAVAQLTARAADRLGLSDRGRIAKGKRADLVLLDPERYLDTATFDDPVRLPEGVAGVWVAGVAVWKDGKATGARPGGVVRDPLPRRGA